MAEQNDVLLREIDEELRQDKALQIWRSYSKALIGAAVIIVAAVAGYQFWTAQVLQARHDASAKFAEAATLAGTNEVVSALDQFQALADQDGGYGLLARFQSASLHHQQGNIDAARDIYRAIEAETANTQIYRDLAVLLEANMTLNQAGAELSLQEGRLAPLDMDDNPLRFSVRETLALIALKKGDGQAARDIYQKLADDQAAPDRLRGRATEMLAAIP